MAKARVELVRALSHDGHGRVFKKGEPQIVDNESDIAYYQAQSEFSVTILKEVKPKKTESKADSEENADETVDPPTERYTAESLGKYTKNELINMAVNAPFGLHLDNEMKKSEMVEAMLIAIEGDDENEG